MRVRPQIEHGVDAPVTGETQKRLRTTEAEATTRRLNSRLEHRPGPYSTTLQYTITG